MLGAGAALACARVFAVRDNVVRWAARDADAAAAHRRRRLAHGAVSSSSLRVVLRAATSARLRRALRRFAPAGLTLAAAYACLFEAFDRGRVSIVAPLNATQSLWAVVFSALLGRHAI